MRRTEDNHPQTGRRPAQAESPRLRIARDVDAGPRRASRTDDAPVRPARVRTDREAHREWEVAAENRAAATGISAFDARWVLAVRAADAIEGGRAAVLRPESRQRLLHTARGLGIRPFDANLVLAIVQDAARDGRTPRDDATVEQLAMVHAPDRTDRVPGKIWVLLLLLCSAVWAAALTWWLLG